MREQMTLPTKEEQVQAAFARLEKCETISVKSSQSGRVFQITGSRSKLCSAVRGYTVTFNGNVQRGYNKIMLDRQRVLEWLHDLEIVG